MRAAAHLDASGSERRAPAAAFAISAGAAIALAGCTVVSAEESQELAAWEGCIEGAIAERSGKNLSGQAIYFEVTYQCRNLFPDWDRAGKSRRGRKLLTKLYSRLVM